VVDETVKLMEAVVRNVEMMQYNDTGWASALEGYVVGV
jgi:hypothetical protein